VEEAVDQRGADPLARSHELVLGILIDAIDYWDPTLFILVLGHLDHFRCRVHLYNSLRGTDELRRTETQTELQSQLPQQRHRFQWQSLDDTHSHWLRGRLGRGSPRTWRWFDLQPCSALAWSAPESLWRHWHVPGPLLDHQLQLRQLFELLHQLVLWPLDWFNFDHWIHPWPHLRRLVH